LFVRGDKYAECANVNIVGLNCIGDTSSGSRGWGSGGNPRFPRPIGQVVITNVARLSRVYVPRAYITSK
jgi:hypothetical protein